MEDNTRKKLLNGLIIATMALVLVGCKNDVQTEADAPEEPQEEVESIEEVVIEYNHKILENKQLKVEFSTPSYSKDNGMFSLDYRIQNKTNDPIMLDRYVLVFYADGTPIDIGLTDYVLHSNVDYANTVELEGVSADEIFYWNIVPSDPANEEPVATFIEVIQE